MKAPALVAVEGGPESFAALFAAAAARGVRLGWLDLAPPANATSPADLERATALGARRAVVVGGGRSVAVKPLAGPPVLRDLLREHFLGCTLVLVRGIEGWPRLRPDEDAWVLEESASRRRRLEAGDLLAELARPRRRFGAREDAK